MSQRINIGGVKDDHYRYTMEKMITKIESRGNGIKTVIVNMTNVAKDLKVPADYPTKYFSAVLGASNESKDGKFVIKGSFTQTHLEGVLQEFIRKFVLCPKCSLPETDMTVKGDMVHLDCKACSHHAVVDPREKLVKYIVAHPPPKQKSYVHKTTQDAEAVQKATAGKTTTTTQDDDDDVEWSTDISAEAVKKRQAKEKTAAQLLGGADSDEEDENKDEEDGEEEEEEISPTQVLAEYIKAKPDASEDQLIKVVKKIKVDYELADSDAICLLCEAFFTKKADLMETITKRAKVFAYFLGSDKKNEKQLLMLGYIEDFLASHQDLVPKVSKILEVAYDAEVLREPAILEWHAKKKSKFVKDAELLKKIKESAKKFVEWLGAAEEEEVPVKAPTKATKAPAPAKQAPPTKAAPKVEDIADDEDFDAL